MTVPGDFSGNGVLDAADIDAIQAAVAAGDNPPIFDLDRDGTVDKSDVDYWLEQVANTRRGDANLDGTVDFQDFLFLSANFGATEASWRDGDFDDSDGIEFADFLLLNSNFGWTRLG